MDFTFTPASGEEPLVVDFTPVLEDAPTEYLWTFGDGTTSAESVPSHIYYVAGTYSVTLAVVYADGEPSSTTKTDCIVVSEGPLFRESDGLYWLDRGNGSIARGSRDGVTTKKTVVSGIPTAWCMAVGTANVFWGTSTAIWRAGLDGSGKTAIVTSLPPVEDLVVDTAQNRLYWVVFPSSSYLTNQFDGGIYRANLDGSSRQTFKSYAASSQYFATQVTVDPVGQFVYWFYARTDVIGPLATPKGWAGDIQGSLASGVPVTTLYSLNEGDQLAASIGLAHTAQYLYWTDSDAGKIRKGKIDGSGMQVILSGLPHPQGVAVSASDNALFWSDDDGIHRATLDGTNARVLYAGVNADVIDVGP